MLNRLLCVPGVNDHQLLTGIRFTKQHRSNLSAVQPYSEVLISNCVGAAPSLLLNPGRRASSFDSQGWAVKQKHAELQGSLLDITPIAVRRPLGQRWGPPGRISSYQTFITKHYRDFKHYHAYSQRPVSEVKHVKSRDLSRSGIVSIRQDVDQTVLRMTSTHHTFLGYLNNVSWEEKRVMTRWPFLCNHSSLVWFHHLMTVF